MASKDIRGENSGRDQHWSQPKEEYREASA